MERRNEDNRSISRLTLFHVALVVCLASPVAAIEWTQFEGTARGYPVVRDLSGRFVANGDFAQWIAGNRLHVRLTYTFPRGRQVIEEIVLRQQPELAQDSWSLRDLEHGRTSRAFTADFGTGIATAMKYENGEMKRWSETLDLRRGETFAGFGFSLAIKALRARLVKGQTVTLQAVGFSPKPRLVSVELSHAGRDRIRMAGRTIVGDRFVIHPKIPAIAKLFVKVPDATIWLTTPPAGFLRWEGPLVEPNDQLVRVDLLPGGVSEAATPVATSGKRD